MKKNYKQPAITFVIPSFNEEENIAKTIDSVQNSLKDFKISGELVVVNDASTDLTGEIVKQKIKEYPENIQLVSHKKNMGVGRAFWSGIDGAKGEVVVMVPGDNENDPKEVLKFFNLISEVDIVIPFIFNKDIRSSTRQRLSALYIYIVNLIFFTKLNYTNGTTLYRTSLLRELRYRANGFFYQSDILIRLVKSGYLYAEVPHSLSQRHGGKSSALKFSSFLTFLKESTILFLDCYVKRNIKIKKTFASNTITAKKRGSKKWEN